MKTTLIWFIFCTALFASDGSKDRFAFWPYRGMKLDGDYLPLRIDPNDDALVFLTTEVRTVGGAPMFISTGAQHLDVQIDGQWKQQEFVEVPADATPTFFLNIRHNRGPEVIAFECRRLIDLMERCLVTNHKAIEADSDYTIRVCIPLYRVDANGQSFTASRWIQSEPIIIRLRGHKIVLTGYYADGFLETNGGLRRFPR
jgi:hypothetical protein